MNPTDVLRIVDSLHREKNIEKEIVFRAIEAALISAAKKYYGDEREIEFQIEREDGAITGSMTLEDGTVESLDYEETIGRIGAQTAKQVIIQKVREAERDALIEEFQEQLNDLVSGVVQRSEGSTTLVSLGSVEAILPRSEQIPGETHHANERIRSVIFEVRPQGSRVKVVLSRTRPALVQRLFEQEIPEISEGVISINAMSREPGYRSKVAVSSTDQRVDCVGACVGVRGSRIKNIIDELHGERIDIVPWSEDAQELIANALKPAEVEEVILCQMMGRAIVLVNEDQLSLAIGRHGRNVRLASKLCGWDIEIMTQSELEEQIERAVSGFMKIKGIDDEIANRLVGEGYLSYDDLSVIEPTDLMEMGNMTEEEATAISDLAEEMAEQAEAAAKVAKARDKANEAARAAEEAIAKQQAEADAKAESAQAEESSSEEVASSNGATEESQSEESAAATESEPASEPTTDEDVRQT
jgi:N utilization substance protein A